MVLVEFRSGDGLNLRLAPLEEDAAETAAADIFAAKFAFLLEVAVDHSLKGALAFDLDGLAWVEAVEAGFWREFVNRNDWWLLVVVVVVLSYDFLVVVGLIMI